MVVTPRSSRPTLLLDAAVELLDLVGPGDIAERLGVTSAAVGNWTGRGLLPAPLAVVSCGPIYRWSTIRAWAIETGRLRPDALAPSTAPSLAASLRGLAQASRTLFAQQDQKESSDVF